MMITVQLLVLLTHLFLRTNGLSFSTIPYNTTTSLYGPAYGLKSDGTLYIIGGHPYYQSVTKWNPNQDPNQFTVVTNTGIGADYVLCYANCATVVTENDGHEYMHIIGNVYATGPLKFDLNTEMFVTSQIPSIGSEAGCVVTDGLSTIYYAGGTDQQNKQLNMINVSVTNPTWQALPDMFDIRYYQYCAFAQNSIYYFGGFYPDAVAHTDLWRYDIVYNQWSVLNGSLSPNAVLAGRAVYDATNKKIYTTGGSSESGSSRIIGSFDVGTQTLSYDPSNYMIETRANHIGVIILEKLYILYGTNTGGTPKLKTIEVSELSNNCEEKGLINRFHWNTRTTLPLYYNNKITVNTDDLSIDINIDLDYLGYSYNQYDQYGFGTIYVLSFVPYDSESPINEPNSKCGENRISSSYSGLSFADYWRYSDYIKLNNINYTAYATPGDLWSLSLSTMDCKINYFGNFKWSDMNECEGIITSEDTNYINLTGYFYVSIVSPFDKDTESGIYYVQPLYSQEFVISVGKSVHILGDVVSRLFTMSVIDIKPNNVNNSIQVLLGTQSNDGLYLHSPQLLVSPNNDFIFNNALNNGGCIANNSDPCYQFWETTTIVTFNCPYSFDGTFIIQFEIDCISCPVNYSKTITLTADLKYAHNICDNNKSVDIKPYFNGNFSFYFDSDYTNLYDKLNNNHYYLAGKDRIYSQNMINNPNDTYNTFDIQLNNVWICSRDDETFGVLTLNPSDPTNTGCFDPNVDFMEWIIINHNQTFYENSQLENENINNIVRFSFIPPIIFNSQKLYVHSQITVSILNVQMRRRRRILLNVLYDNSNQINSHFTQSIRVQSQTQQNDDIKKHNDNNRSMILIIIIVVLTVLIILAILMFTVVQIKKSKQETDGIVTLQTKVSVNEEIYEIDDDNLQTNDIPLTPITTNNSFTLEMQNVLYQE